MLGRKIGRVWRFPGGPMVKNLPANAGDLGLIPGLGRSPGEGNGNPRQYSCLGFPDSSVGKESACNAGDPGSIPGSGRSTGEGIHYPLQYSWASPMTQLVKNPPAMRETCVQSLDWEESLEKEKATHSSILAWRMKWRSETWRIWEKNCAVLSCSVMSDFLWPTWTEGHQPPLPWGFSRQEYWSGLPCPPQDGSIRKVFKKEQEGQCCQSSGGEERV